MSSRVANNRDSMSGANRPSVQASKLSKEVGKGADRSNTPNTPTSQGTQGGEQKGEQQERRSSERSQQSRASRPEQRGGEQQREQEQAPPPPPPPPPPPAPEQGQRSGGEPRPAERERDSGGRAEQQGAGSEAVREDARLNDVASIGFSGRGQGAFRDSPRQEKPRDDDEESARERARQRKVAQIGFRDQNAQPGLRGVDVFRNDSERQRQGERERDEDRQEDQESRQAPLPPPPPPPPPPKQDERQERPASELRDDLSTRSERASSVTSIGSTRDAESRTSSATASGPLEHRHFMNEEHGLWRGQAYEGARKDIPHQGMDDASQSSSAGRRHVSITGSRGPASTASNEENGRWRGQAMLGERKAPAPGGFPRERAEGGRAGGSGGDTGRRLVSDSRRGAEGRDAKHLSLNERQRRADAAGA